jgi:hypothetical protein
MDRYSYTSFFVNFLSNFLSVETMFITQIDIQKV